MRALAKSLTATVIVFLVAEIALRGVYLVRNSMVRYVTLPYAFGDDYGPIPPWVNALRILESDRTLIWKHAPNVHRTYVDVFSPVRTEQDRIALLRRFVPTVPEEFRHNPTWEIRLNSEGFRGGEVSAEPVPATIRIACIGDSWTFGMPVDQDETYPSRLANWLRLERPGERYEVQNFGVLGYSSFQGLQLLKTRVLDFKPDVVVIGFGMNDSEVAGSRDKDSAAEGPPSFSDRVKDAVSSAAQHVETYKLLKFAALALRFHPKPIGDLVAAEAAAKDSGSTDYDAIEPWTRVSPRDFDANIRQMIHLASEHGARVVLVDNELWEGSPYRARLKRIAFELDEPFVDSLAIINAARASIEQALEARMALARSADRLPPARENRTAVVFRVFHGSAAVPKALSIAGSDAQLGALVPNLVTMHDDGMGGDQRAGDGVWSYAAALKPQTSVFYVYTNSGTPGQWEGLDVPHIRRANVPASLDGRPVYLPIETFGQVYMQGDDWHPNAAGYDAIARAVAREIARPD